MKNPAAKPVLSWEHLKKLSQTKDSKGWIRLCSPLGALAFTSVGIHHVSGGFWLLGVLFVHGLFLISLFAPLHESIHRTAFRSRWVNQWVAHGCGFLLFLPPRYFRSFHLAHHRHTQDPQHDPELFSEKPQNWATYLWQMSGIPYWKERLGTLVWHGLGKINDPGFLPPTVHGKIITEARVFLVGYGLVFFSSLIWGAQGVLFYWIFPVLLAQPVLRFYLLAEHADCSLGNDGFFNTRTVRTHPVIRHFMWEMPYHLEHHLYPSVPFHQLPTLHQITSQHPGCWSPGYFKFHRDYVAKICSPSVEQNRL